MPTFRPLPNPARRLMVSAPFSFLSAVGLVAVFGLSGCSSKKAVDTSAVVAVETTVAVGAPATETAAASVETTVASVVDSSVVSPETTAEALPGSSDSTAASGDSAAADNGATPTSVDPQAAMEAAIVSGMSSQLGVTDPKQIACVTESVKGVDFANPEGQGKILRGVLKCAPDAMAVQGAKSLREANPTVTEKQSVCVVKATFEVLSAMADSELVAAMSSSKLSPAIVEATLAKAKGCGLSEAEIRKAMQQ